MLFLWFYHACKRGAPRFMMVADHINYLTFEDPGAVHTVRRALKLAEAGDLYGAAETAGVDVSHAAVVSQGLRRGMRFSIGAELDNDPRARPDAQNIVDAMRPDGMIRSVHFLTISHPEKGPDWQWPFDNPEFSDLYDTVGVDRVWELYMTKLLDDIAKLPGHIVGHFYVPASFGHWPDQKTLEHYEDRLLDACAGRGMAIEINTRFLYRDNPDDLKQKYRSALARLAKKAKRTDVGVAIGADAHSPKDQGNGFSEILKILDDADINELVFPVAGRLARVALRATQEHLQKVKAQEPAPQPGSSISGFSRAELGLPEREELEERELVSGLSKPLREGGPRKRAGGPARTTTKPGKEPSERVARVKPQSTVLSAPKPVSKAKAHAKTEAKSRADSKAKKVNAVSAGAKVKDRPHKAATRVAKTSAANKNAAKNVKAAARAKTKPARASVKLAASAKKASGKKSAAKRPQPKKAAATKKTAPKRSTAKRTPAKKAAAKKPAAKRKVSTAKRTAKKKAPSKRR
jgi:HisJ family histidinol phosphate phosphatase